jgi:hypothetical protein
VIDTNQGAEPLDLVVLEVSFVDGAICVFNRSLSVAHVRVELALVVRPVFIGRFALALK